MTKSKIELPTKAAFVDAMQVAKTSIEGAKYLRDQLINRLEQAKILDESAELIQQAKGFVVQIAMQLSSGYDSWVGRRSANTTFTNMHANIAAEAAKALSGDEIQKKEELVVNLNYAVGTNGEILRGWEPDDRNTDLDARADSGARQSL